MYKGFKLSITEEQLETIAVGYEDYIAQGRKQLENQKNNYSKSLKDFVINGKTIDGTGLQDTCFPQVEADIFLSHSHKDEKLALALAGWIYTTFKLTTFIDSVVWRFSDEIRAELNNTYSDMREKEGGKLYSHEKCNKVGQHVDMMLNVALHTMIDKTEALFLLNTDNAIPTFGVEALEVTYSPWLYSEIVCSNIIRKIVPQRILDKKRNTMGSYKYNEGNTQVLNVSYKIDTSGLIELTENGLKEWAEKCEKPENNLYDSKKGNYPLDVLYEQKEKKTHLYD